MTIAKVSRGVQGGNAPPLQGLSRPPAYDTITNPSPALPNVPPTPQVSTNFAPVKDIYLRLNPACIVGVS